MRSLWRAVHRSEEFRVRWASHDVKFHRTGVQRHPRRRVVGQLTLAYEALEMPGHSDQRILVYAAGPGRLSQEALNLASGASTPTVVPGG